MVNMAGASIRRIERCGIMFGGLHRADLLWGRLAFLPLYARQSRLKYIRGRIIGWVRGWRRLVLLRFFDPRSINANSDAESLYGGGLDCPYDWGCPFFLPAAAKNQIVRCGALGRACIPLWWLNDVGSP